MDLDAWYTHLTDPATVAFEEVACADSPAELIVHAHACCNSVIDDADGVSRLVAGSDWLAATTLGVRLSAAVLAGDGEALRELTRLGVRLGPLSAGLACVQLAECLADPGPDGGVLGFVAPAPEGFERFVGLLPDDASSRIATVAEIVAGAGVIERGRLLGGLAGWYACCVGEVAEDQRQAAEWLEAWARDCPQRRRVVGGQRVE